MAQLALVQMLVIICLASSGMISVAHGDNYFVTIDDIVRSPVCVIELLAQKLKIEAKFNFTGETTTNKTKYFNYSLKFGTDNPYDAFDVSKKKAKNKVAALALNATKYEHPQLNNRTCIVPSLSRTDVSILYEYATVLDTTLVVEEAHISIQPPTFEVTLRLNGKSATATGFNKKKVKKEAATKLIAALNREEVLKGLTRRYNAPKYQNMNPVERLNKILFTNDADPAIYTIAEQPNSSNGHRFKVNLNADDVETVGTGETLEKAYTDGATRALQSMDFTVL